MTRTILEAALTVKNDSTQKREKRDRGSGCLIPPRPGVTQFWTIQVYDKKHKAVRRSTHIRGELKPGCDPKKTDSWTNITAARLFLKKLVDSVGSGTVAGGSDPSQMHYEDLRALYLHDYEEQKNRSLLEDVETGEKYVCGLKHLDNFFKGWKVSAIGVDAIARFKTERRKANAENGTINRSLAALRRMFKLAEKKGKLQLTPPVDMLPEPEQPRQGFLEIADYERLSNSLPEYVRPLLQVGFYTGMRLGEILNLKWSSVDLGNNVIRLAATATKNKSLRTIPLIDGLPELFESIRQANPDAGENDPVFLSAKGEPIGSFIKAWRKACIRAAIPTKLDDTEVISHFEPNGKYVGFLFHDLRRSAVSNMIRAGIPTSIAKAISGHKTDEVFRRYNIISEKPLQDAASQLARYLDTQKKEAATAPNLTKKRLRVAK